MARRPIEPTAETFLGELARVVERLRTMGEPRLGARSGPEASRADGAREVAQRFADTAAAAAGEAARLLPRLSDLAVGDQLGVTGHDLVASGVSLEEPLTLLRSLRSRL